MKSYLMTAAVISKLSNTIILIYHLLQLDSEYKSHFKALPVHRPVLVKAKVLSHPSDNAPEVLESSRRAGLLSNQFSKVGEPALQRKRIVPYKYNHNIFPTSTVKELDDGQWIDSVGTDEESNRSHSQVQKGKQNMVMNVLRT